MSVTPFLMFEGRAQDAIDLYRAVLPNVTVETLQPMPPEVAEQTHQATGREAVGGGGPLIMMAVLDIDGLKVRINDTPIQHDFTFTPALSMFFETTEPAAFRAALAGLSEDGQVRMEDRDDYGFAKRFAWVDDRFGVSWQLALM